MVDKQTIHAKLE